MQLAGNAEIIIVLMNCLKKKKLHQQMKVKGVKLQLVGCNAAAKCWCFSSSSICISWILYFIFIFYFSYLIAVWNCRLYCSNIFMLFYIRLVYSVFYILYLYLYFIFSSKRKYKFAAAQIFHICILYFIFIYVIII